MCSHKERANEMEAEARVYWRIMQEGFNRFRKNPQDPVLHEYRDEIETIAEMTDWPTMRSVCGRSLRLDDKIRIPFISVSARFG